MKVLSTFFIMKQLFPFIHWDVPTVRKELFLTFDDGPMPGLTPWVLDTLRQFNAKATFFCLGKNAEQNPELIARIRTEGHSIGNHTFAHSNGWKSNTRDYLDDVERGASILETKLFRPPHGRLKPSQVIRLRKKYNIVMWNSQSNDYDTRVSPDECFDRVLRSARFGSIMLFHDNIKAERNIRFVLPKVLEHYSLKGFRFENLERLVTS